MIEEWPGYAGNNRRRDRSKIDDDHGTLITTDKGVHKWEVSPGSKNEALKGM